MRSAPSTALVVAQPPFAAVARRALLVDDVVCNLEWISELLLSFGFDSTVAMSIAEAKKALTHLVFEVVFLDCELPDGFGYSLAAEIREMGLAQTPSIIGMTSSDDNEMMLRYFSAGAQAFIRKPVSFDLVCDSLRRCELLDINRIYDEPVRPKLSFNNIRFMARGDGDRFQAYLQKIAKQLETEVTSLVGACKNDEPDAARVIVHRLLSLTPLLESREFTNVLQSCQRVARWHNLHLLRKLGQAVELEYCLVKTSLQDELDQHQRSQNPSLRKSA
jgi:CheY-like chemotaxis protein